MIDDERSAEARAVAELALIRLLTGSAPTSELLIVLGGLVPPTLTSTVPTAPAHLDTTDVDVLPAESLVTPMGCSTLQAVNLRGTGSVEHGYRDMTLSGPDGPRAYAQESLKVTPGEDAALLAADAAAAVREFFGGTRPVRATEVTTCGRPLSRLPLNS